MKEKELRNLYIYYNVKYLNQTYAVAMLNACNATGEAPMSTKLISDIYKRYCEKYAKAGRKEIEAMIGKLEGGGTHV